MSIDDDFAKLQPNWITVGSINWDHLHRFWESSTK